MKMAGLTFHVAERLLLPPECADRWLVVVGARRGVRFISVVGSELPTGSTAFNLTTRDYLIIFLVSGFVRNW
jgi:hypothetical protein